MENEISIYHDDQPNEVADKFISLLKKHGIEFVDITPEGSESLEYKMIVKNGKVKKLKWWQRKVRGWTVPFWYTDTPLCSYEFAQLSQEEQAEIAEIIRQSRKNAQS